VLDVVVSGIDAADQLLAVIAPLWLRLVLWGTLAGVASILMYAAASNQSAIAALKQRGRETRARLLDPDVETFADFSSLARENLAVSLRLLGKVLGPAAVSAIPVLLLVVWLDAFHGFESPGAAGSVFMTPVPASAAVAVRPGGEAAESNGLHGYRVPVLAAGEELRVVADGRPIYTGNPFHPPVVSVYQKRWWNALAGNPAGYLAPGSGVQELRFDVAPKRVISVGPAWARGWEMLFFTAVLVAAVAAKILLRIE
jgi:hypothetical protein